MVFLPEVFTVYRVFDSRINVENIIVFNDMCRTFIVMQPIGRAVSSSGNSSDIILIDNSTRHLSYCINCTTVMKSLQCIDNPVITDCIIFAGSRILKVAPSPSQMNAIIRSFLYQIVRYFNFFHKKSRNSCASSKSRSCADIIKNVITDSVIFTYSFHIGSIFCMSPAISDIYMLWMTNSYAAGCNVRYKIADDITVNNIVSHVYPVISAVFDSIFYKIN